MNNLESVWVCICMSVTIVKTVYLWLALNFCTAIFVAGFIQVRIGKTESSFYRRLENSDYMNSSHCFGKA